MNLLKDLANITDIKEYNLQRLTDIISKLISHYTFCARQEGLNCIDIDLGKANLIIRFEDDGISYKFVPGKDLNEAIKRAYNNKDTELIDGTIKLIGQRINKTYKELL